MKKQGGFLYWFLIPALVGQGILAAAGLSATAPAKQAAVQTQSGPVASASGVVSTN